MAAVDSSVDNCKRKAEDEVEIIEVKKLKSSLNENGKEKNGEASETTPLEKDIIRQIEYYFGDMNLPRDKFMLEQIKLDEGWITMSIMLKFQRLAKLSTDPKVIAQALSYSQLMEVDESGEEIKMRRSPEHPLPEVNEQRRKELQERTVYCKGFPLDSVIDTVIEFFKSYGPVENIIMRKYKDTLNKTYKFKGSVFVTFSSKEKAQVFLDIETVKHGEQNLTRMWQLDYVEAKKKEMLEYKLKKNKKGVIVKEEPLKDDLPRGATLHLSGEFNELSREDIKQKFSDHGFETAYVSFNKGDTEAYVRLQEGDAGKAFLEKAGSEIEMQKSKFNARLLEGEEEETFLQKAIADRDAYFKKCHTARQGGRKGKGMKGQRNDRGKEGKGRRKKGNPAKNDDLDGPSSD